MYVDDARFQLTITERSGGLDERENDIKVCVAHLVRKSNKEESGMTMREMSFQIFNINVDTWRGAMCVREKRKNSFTLLLVLSVYSDN